LTSWESELADTEGEFFASSSQCSIDADQCFFAEPGKVKILVPLSQTLRLALGRSRGGGGERRRQANL
jgi:hypothetical protein